SMAGHRRELRLDHSSDGCGDERRRSRRWRRFDRSVGAAAQGRARVRSRLQSARNAFFARRSRERTAPRRRPRHAGATGGTLPGPLAARHARHRHHEVGGRARTLAEEQMTVAPLSRPMTVEDTIWPSVRVDGNLERARVEWLHTNGAGAYASSTVAQM